MENYYCKFYIKKAKFLNSCVILVIANYIVHQDNIENIMWTDKGLSSDALFVMISNALFNNILKIFDIL